MADKYDPKGPFNDPVVRCDACQKLLLRAGLTKIGCCEHCGNRRVRNLTVFNEKELEQMKAWNVDPEFIALFEVTA